MSTKQQPAAAAAVYPLPYSAGAFKHMVELPKFLPTHSSIAERDVQRATAVSKRWGRGTVTGSNESLTIGSTMRERVRGIKDESQAALSRAGGRGNTMREYFQDESKRTALDTLDALAQLPAEACGDVPKSQKRVAEAATDAQNLADLLRKAPQNKTRRMKAKSTQLATWRPLTSETMPFSVTHGVKLLQSNTGIADMQEMLVGYATTHTPDLASALLECGGHRGGGWQGHSASAHSYRFCWTICPSPPTVLSISPHFTTTRMPWRVGSTGKQRRLQCS